MITRWLALAFVAALGAAAMPVSRAYAESGAPEGQADDGSTHDVHADEAGDRAQAFRAVQGAPGDGASGELLLVASYAVAWALVFAYVFSLARRLRTIERQLADVERRATPEARST